MKKSNFYNGYQIIVTDFCERVAQRVRCQNWKAPASKPHSVISQALDLSSVQG